VIEVRSIVVENVPLTLKSTNGRSDEQYDFDPAEIDSISIDVYDQIETLSDPEIPSNEIS
jgi:hypothetical protein